MIYFIRDPLTRRVKIGYSDTPWARFAQVQTGCPTDLILAAVIEGGKEDEGGLHQRFAEYRVRGEWFAETSALADYIATLPTPIKQSARSLRPAKSPLDAWMTANGVKNRELAQRFGYGEPFISQLRNGTRQPTLDFAVDLVDLTGLTARDLVVFTPGRLVRKRAA